MKKLLTIIVTIMMAFQLIACSSKPTEDKEKTEEIIQEDTSHESDVEKTAEELQDEKSEDETEIEFAKAETEIELEPDMFVITDNISYALTSDGAIEIYDTYGYPAESLFSLLTLCNSLTENSSVTIRFADNQPMMEITPSTLVSAATFEELFDALPDTIAKFARENDLGGNGDLYNFLNEDIVEQVSTNVEAFLSTNSLLPAEHDATQSSSKESELSKDYKKIEIAFDKNNTINISIGTYDNKDHPVIMITGTLDSTSIARYVNIETFRNLFSTNAEYVIAFDINGDTYNTIFKDGSILIDTINSIEGDIEFSEEQSQGTMEFSDVTEDLYIRHGLIEAHNDAE